MMFREGAIIKFNGGNPVLLCQKCNTVIKKVDEFDEEELKFIKGEIFYLSPRYCDNCIAGRYKKGTTMYWKSTHLAAYQKMDDDDFGWWVSLDSTFYVTEIIEKEKVDVVYPEEKKPLYKDGKLNRLAFKWTDQQVTDYFQNIMLIQ